MKKRRLKDCRLYVIIDEKTAGGKNIVDIAKKAIAGGADIIQLRPRTDALAKDILKTAVAIKAVISNANGARHKKWRQTPFAKCLFIINDRVDIAYAVDADGVHLGQGDLPIKSAREILGPDKIIGLSTHSLSQAIWATQRLPVDYISVGPVFSTATKPEYKAIGLGLIKKVSSKIDLVFFAIGGINHKNIDKVIANGAGRVAVVRAVVSADDVKGAAASLRGALDTKCQGRLAKP